MHQKNIRLGVKINPKEGFYPTEEYYNEASKYPEIAKDAAFIVKKEVSAGSLMEEIKRRI